MTRRIPLRLLALEAALQENRAGVYETGPNWSPRIAEYHANLEPPIVLTAEQGYAWCAMFVQFCADKAARGWGLPNPLDDVAREALVLDYHALADARQWLIPRAEVLAGDLVLFDFPTTSRPWDHIGFVVTPPRDGTEFVSVEGNTDDEGGREGIKVALRTRTTARYPVAFARWDEGLEVDFGEPEIELVEKMAGAEDLLS